MLNLPQSSYMTKRQSWWIKTITRYDSWNISLKYLNKACNNNKHTYEMGLVARKPVFGVSDSDIPTSLLSYRD